MINMLYSLSRTSVAMSHANPLSGLSLWSGGCIQLRESLYQCVHVQKLFLWYCIFSIEEHPSKHKNMPLRNSSRSLSGIHVRNLVEAWHRFKCKTSLINNNNEELYIHPSHVTCLYDLAKSWASVRNSHYFPPSIHIFYLFGGKFERETLNKVIIYFYMFQTYYTLYHRKVILISLYHRKVILT